ncbi:MAG: protein translocase subunit SecD [Streptosporangiaceae bacterium]
MAPSRPQASHPGRHLAVLAVLLIAMLAGVLGADIVSPASWHKNFKVGLGLDLSSGTTVTLKAVTQHGTPSQSAMKEASSIMLSRVNGAGFTGAQVQQQGTNIITVSVPGQGADKVVNLVGATALLRFRQVLLEAPGYPTAVTTPTPSPSASSSASSKASAKPSASSTAKPGGSAKSVRARRLTAASAGAGAAAKPSPSASATGKASASASPSPSATATPSVTTKLPTVADASGDASLVSPAVQKQFNELNCRTDWQKKIYGNDPAKWDDVHSQIVSCGKVDGQWIKYVLDVAKVTGTEVTSPAAGLDSTSGQWVVNFDLNSQGSKAFGALTSELYTKYAGSQTNVLNHFAIVLDGKIIEAPYVQGVITNQGQISGAFTQASAQNLATVLKYGALPLTFTKQSIDSVSPQLGTAQLNAGLIAAMIGLLLVVIYSFLYYRGLGVVSVSSLIIAAALSYLSVVLLSKYNGFTLSLAGVAGLIVAIGITADSFVVFFERLRDEVREGKSLRAAVERGWQRARRTILVSDTVSFLAAALLYIFAIGDVKGFAFTLGLTTIIDVVVVFLFTKPMVTLLARTEFYGRGHKLSGLDPARLGARSPWRGTRRTTARPVPGGTASATSAGPARTTPKEA